MRTGLAGTAKCLPILLCILVALGANSVAAADQNPLLAPHVGEGDDTSLRPNPLAIAKLDVDVALKGDTAHTTVTAQFLNDGPSQLEGDFVFDLPPGSVVTGYALDVNDQMVEGVLAERHQATVAFETRERHRVDPGLAEVTRSGAFSTRVFPIVPNKGRIVRLEFVTPLEPGKAFSIPLSTVKPVGALTIHVSADSATAPALRSPDGVPMTWTGAAGHFQATGSASALAPSGAISVDPVAPARPVLLARHRNGETFFEINDVAEWAVQANVSPRHVRIYWDSSLSRRDANLAAEIDFASRYIAATHPELVDLVFFSTDEPHRLTLKKPSTEEIAAALKATDYQGGTSLRPVLDDAAGGADACLLFSDGNITVDAYRAQRVACPLSTVSSAPDANRALLAALARKSGGEYADLAVRAPSEGIALLLGKAPRVVAVHDAKGRDVDYAVLPASGNRIRVAGPLPDSGDIVVTLSHGEQHHYAIDRARIADNDAPGALWASQHLGEMAATDRPDRDAMLALSRRFSVESSVSSFIVFENALDYVNTGLEPPASLGEAFLAEYRQLKADHDDNQARDQHERLDEVVAKWNQEKIWWNTKFKPRPPKLRSPGTPRAVDEQTSPVTDAINAPPPPPPPPPPPTPSYAAEPSARAALAGNAIETTVVTAEKKPDAGAEGPEIQIQIAAWNPDRPYIKALNAAAPEAYWTVYREQEKLHGGLPAFYLDAGEFFFRHGRREDAIRIALNTLELPAANTATMTILADRLMRYGDTARALWLYEHILMLEPERPQPRRNLALALVERAEHGGESDAERRRDYSRALGLLNDIVVAPWSANFNGIEVISLMEANRIIPKLKALGVEKVPLDPRLIALLDVDIRITLEWNTDGTDMDLWVDEPTGERAIYNNPRTEIGGRLSNDMTNGYGPEEYLLRRAPDGAYTVRVNAFRVDSLNPNGATMVRVHVFRNYGRADEQVQSLELELKGTGEDQNHVVGTIQVKGNGKWVATGS